MRRCKRLDNFQFDNDHIPHHQIGNVIANSYSAIMNWKCPLFLVLDTGLLQLDRESVFINCLKKPMPKSASHRKSTFDYPLCQGIQLRRQIRSHSSVSVRGCPCKAEGRSVLLTISSTLPDPLARKLTQTAHARTIEPG